MTKKRIKVNNEISYGYLLENDLIPRVKYCKECKFKINRNERRFNFRLHHHNVSIKDVF